MIVVSSQIPANARKKFINAGYRIVGSHSAVSVCHWTKESLRRDRVCYKEKWYGIESHRCMEMTPSIIWCTHKCQFCWRFLGFTEQGEPSPDDPVDIIEESIRARRSLLTGFKGNSSVDIKKWKEAVNPTSVAISLAGEPTLYPRISELIAELDSRNMSTFLVTNGTMPDRLESLEVEPTNLYITLSAPDKSTYLKVNRPSILDGWERLNRSLELMENFDCRKILRLTLVKGLNMKNPDKYAEIISKTQPDFVEPKGYSWVGESRQRLGEKNIPTLDEIRSFSNEIENRTDYSIVEEDENSRVLLMSRK